MSLEESVVCPPQDASDCAGRRNMRGTVAVVGLVGIYARSVIEFPGPVP